MASRVPSTWRALLEEGREDERLVREAFEGSRPGRDAPLPADLPPELAEALRRRGVGRLWSHQARALEIPAPRPFVVTTGTASGKSLCFQLPVLTELLADPRARALLLYPTKALAQDQARSLAAFGLGERVRAAIYDGDTPRELRRDVRTRANVVLTNPDMLHVGILPRADLWADLLANLRVVVVDEAHVYRGVFGSHVANVLRRLRRLAERAQARRPEGSRRPRFLLATATIANPAEHAAALTGLDDVAAIDDDGSPGAGRTIAMWNPPLLDELERREAARAERPPGATGEAPFVAPGVTSAAEALGDAPSVDGVAPDPPPAVQPVDGGPTHPIPFEAQDAPLVDASELVAGRTRISALTEAAELVAGLVEGGTRTICFVRSRKGAEVVARAAADELEERGREDLARRVAAYRAGYTVAQRHELEQQLVGGELLCVVTTTALELGIDIGELDAAVVVTFPGTVASLRQMWGRAGRRRAGLAIYVAGEDALDQYFCRHPDDFLDRPVEAAILLHETEPIHLAHLLCAAHEAPLDDRDAGSLGPRWRAHAEELARRGLLRERAGAFRPLDPDRFAAGDLSLRSASAHRVLIVDGETGEELGHVEEDKAPSTVHDGAVYLHRGREYEVTTLSLPTGHAVVEEFRGTWWTQPKRETDIAFERILDARTLGAGAATVPLSLGSVTVTDTVLAYQRRRRGSGEVIDLRTVDLPSVSFETEAVWFEPGALIHGTTPDGRTAIPGGVGGGTGSVGGGTGSVGGGTGSAGVGASGPTGAAAVNAAGDPFPTEVVLGALHAAEHALIAVLPLLAMCDRWDVGGLSTNLHPQTGGPAIVVYEGHVGGVGIVRQAFARFEEWVGDARRLVAECPCESGCPSCVQSPKCGNLNEPLHKAGALELLERLAAVGPSHRPD